jgi:aldose 1-epimerase
VGDRALPYGAGFHPYLTVGTHSIDEAVLRLPASQVLEVDERMIPTGKTRDVAGSELDFRSGRRIGGQRLDACFARDGGEVLLSKGGRAVRLWMDERFKYVQVYTGDNLPAHLRRTAIAIEPMTCPPNAFQSGTDLVRLEPGQRHTCTWGVGSSI